MKNDKLLELLTELGLSQHESSVYLAALSLGPSSILDIARASDIKRTTVYSVIEHLITKGLMAVRVHGSKKTFVAETPERLEQVIDQHRTLLATALPELMGLYNLKSGQSLIKYYQGMKGVRVVYDGILDELMPRDHFMVITDQERFVGLDPDYFLEFIAKRRAMHIHMRLLMQDSSIARRQQQERVPNETIKILPKGNPLTTDLVITPNKVVILDLAMPLTTLVVESKSIVELHKELFEIIWRTV